MESRAPKVSIVVPVYNAEKYLKKCLDSICSQTLKEFECILVDDGSKDESGKICDDYAAKDCRFIVIHKANGGVSSARNAALDVAKGEYIGFVDSDDWIESNMFQVLYEDAIVTDCEMVICSIAEEPVTFHDCFLSSKEARLTLFSQFGFQGYSPNKLTKRSAIGANRYNTNMSYYEDSEFFFHVLQSCHRIHWKTVPLYHYVKHEESVTSSYGFSPRSFMGLKELFALAEKESDKDIRRAIFGFIYINYLCKATDYVGQRDVDNDYFKTIAPLLKNKEYLYEMTFRQRIWRLVILSDPLKKLYWLIKKV